MILRSGLKSFAITVLAVIGWMKLKLQRQPTLIILTYHRTLPKHHPDREYEQPGMVTAPEVLAKHVDAMSAIGAEPIHLNEWLNKRKEGLPLPRLSYAVTFDDGWRDNYQYAYPILLEKNVPATIFLVTKLVDTEKTFWPEQVLKLVTTQAIPHAAKEFEWLKPFLPHNQPSVPLSLEEADEVIGKLKSLDDQTILSHLNDLPPIYTDHGDKKSGRAILNTDEVNEMASDGLVKYGGHTRHHFRLNRLDDDLALQQEIAGCMEDLQVLNYGQIPVFCYPNGDITDRGQSLVKAHFQAACTTKLGWNTSKQDSYDLHRFNLHDGNSASRLRLLSTIGRSIL